VPICADIVDPQLVAHANRPGEGPHPFRREGSFRPEPQERPSPSRALKMASISTDGKLHVSGRRPGLPIVFTPVIIDREHRKVGVLGVVVLEYARTVEIHGHSSDDGPTLTED